MLEVCQNSKMLETWCSGRVESSPESVSQFHVLGIPENFRVLENYKIIINRYTLWHNITSVVFRCYFYIYIVAYIISYNYKIFENPETGFLAHRFAFSFDKCKLGNKKADGRLSGQEKFARANTKI